MRAGSIPREGKSTPKHVKMTHRDAMSHECIRVHECHQLVQQVWLALKKLWGQFLHNIFQMFSCKGWDAIPSLRFTPKKNKLVEDTVQQRERKLKHCHRKINGMILSEHFVLMESSITVPFNQKGVIFCNSEPYLKVSRASHQMTGMQ